MDFDSKKPIGSIIASAIMLVGFFVFVWNHEFITQKLPSQTAQIIETFKVTEIDIDHDKLFPALVQYIRTQQETIMQLREENNLLVEQIGSATTSSSTEIALDEIQAQPKILLVAGHTATTKGAVYDQTTEYELNYDLLRKLEREVRSRGFDVVITHKGDDYSPQFLEYFDQNEEQILDYRQNKKDAYDAQYPQGVVTNDTDHNHASPIGVIQLYGVNLWATENNVDAVVHLHYNDYPGRPAGQRGVHSGFSIFAPLKTNDHFVESFKLAKSIEKNMLQSSKRSTVKNESAGVLESELIAVGQANSVTMPAVLIEGGFVYESKFTNPTQREIMLTKQARDIAEGIKQYFEQ